MPDVPSCVGSFDLKDAICNGNSKGLTDADRAPCAWRNRCRALQIHCKERSLLAAQVVRDQSYSGLVTLCEDIIGKYRIVGGVNAFPAKEGKPRRSSPRPSVVREKKKPVTINEEMAKLYDLFTQEMLSLYPDRQLASGASVVAIRNNFYAIDRVASSQYISWYVASGSGRDKAVASIWFKPRLHALNIRLPLSVEGIDEETVARLKMEPYSFRGQFKSMCRALDGPRIVECTQLIKRLADI